MIRLTFDESNLKIYFLKKERKLFMKKMKKFVALLLAVVMALAMTVTAFAEPEDTPKKDYKITVQNNNSHITINGIEYSAYKLFDVTYVGMPGEATNDTPHTYTVAEAFENFTYDTEGTPDVVSGEKLIAYIGTLTSDSEELNKVANAALKYAEENSIAASGSATASNEKAVIELEGAGYYLIGGKAQVKYGDGIKNIDYVVASCAIETTNPTATVNVKADAPSIDKKIKKENGEDPESAKATSVDVGSVVEFELTSKVPDMLGYESYTYVVKDTLSTGLTAVDENADDKVDVTITIGGEEYVGFAVDQDGQNITITFDDFINQKTKKDQDIVITYSAIVNENALTVDKEFNTVTLTYSNNPRDDESFNETPEVKVYVYDFDIVIDKFAADETLDDESDNTRLSDAKFILYKQDGEKKLYYTYNEETKAVAWVETEKDADEKTTDEKGATSFTGLEAGQYYVKEIEAPNGYNLLKDPIEVNITVEYKEDGTIKLDNNQQKITSASQENENAQYKQTVGVENTSGTLLPSTGGIGTTLFYVIGGVLVLAAMALLVLKSRMKTEN